MIDEILRQTFMAAVKIAQSVWGENLYWNGKGVTPPAWNGVLLEDTRCSMPYIWPGALMTTGGIAIHTANFLPAWIETPWGEWKCWGTAFQLDSPLLTGRYTLLEKYFGTLDVDWERSSARSASNILERHGRVALRSVDGFVLLPHKSMPPRGTIQEEWVRLCVGHKPPVPVPPFQRQIYAPT